MNLAELERYISEQVFVTIPEVQRKFALKYGEARAAFQKLQNDKKIKLAYGITFEWCVESAKEKGADASDKGSSSRGSIGHKDAFSSFDDYMKWRKRIDELAAEDDDDEDDDDDDFTFLFDDEENDDNDGKDGKEDKKDKPNEGKIRWHTDPKTLDEMATAIINKLEIFKIKLRLAEYSKGASVTRFSFDVLSERTRILDIKRYANDIRACLGSDYDVRIVAPAIGTRRVEVEVANTIREPVLLDDVIKSVDFKKANGKLNFVLGTDLSNKKVVEDLSQLPHLLVAGTTGSGKSVVLNGLILSIMQKYSPDYVKFLLVDPKFVELSRFNSAPHLLTSEAIVEQSDALAALDYLIEEMENRYIKFKAMGVGNIAEFNSKSGEKLPYLVYVVDELADIMMWGYKQAFEHKLTRLAQKSRASGIHIVLATQRPDVQTVSGTVKMCMPARIALHTASMFDSVTILNTPGAEKLIGRGDMLYHDVLGQLRRIQGAYATSEELRDVIEKLKGKYKSQFDDKIADKIFISKKAEKQSTSTTTQNVEPDPLCRKALRFWLEKQGGRASIASIQRNLGIGFNRAGRIMDYLQKQHYVEELAPTDPLSKPLKVLVTLEELPLLFPDLPD